MALKEYLAEAERCSQCSYCKWVPFDQMKSWRFSKGCPSIAYNNFNSYSVRGRYMVTRALVNNSIKCNEKVLDIANQCCMCGSCDITCKVCRYNLEPLDMIRELRAELVKDGQLLPQHKIYIDHLRKEDNMMLKPKAERGKWAEGLDVKNITTEPGQSRLSCRLPVQL